ncbi:MAG: acyltransferase family protein [candidate division WOR-3 bacterium]
MERLLFIDWLKGLFVIWMVPTHAFDGLFPHFLKKTELYQAVAFYNGLVAPAFLISSGFLALYTFKKDKFFSRLRRGVELMAFGYATQLPFKSFTQTLEHIYLYILGKSPEFFEQSLKTFQRVEILICIGFGAIAITLILYFVEDNFKRLLVFLTLAFLVWGTSPIINKYGEKLPMFIAPYFAFKDTLFPIFPYWGYMFFGSAMASAYLMDKRVFFLITLIPVSFVFLNVFFHFPRIESYLPYILLKTGFLLIILYILKYANNIGYKFPLLAMLGRNSLLSYAFHNTIVYGSPFTKPLRYYYGYQSWEGGLILGGFLLILTVVFIYAWEKTRKNYGQLPARKFWEFAAFIFILSPW